MNKVVKKNRIFGIVVVLLIVYFSLQFYKNFFYNEEIVTYAAANSNFDAWMLSEGKTGKFLKEEIRGHNCVETAGNIVATLKDVAINKKNAYVFNLEKIEQPVWFEKEETYSWLHLDKDTRFNYLSVWYSSLIQSDEAPLFSAMEHTLSSIFYKNSFSKWYPNIINLIAIVLLIHILVLICKECEIPQSTVAWVILVYGFFSGTLMQVIDMRSYTVCIACFMGVVLYHLKLLGCVEQGEEAPAKIYLKMFLFYFVGSTSCFLLHIVGLAIFIVFLSYTVIRRKFPKYGISYAIHMAVTVMISIAPFPRFVSAMLYKFHALNEKKVEHGRWYIINECFNELLRKLSEEKLIAALVIAALVVLFIYLKATKKIGEHIGNRKVYFIYAMTILYLIIQIAAVGRLSNYIWIIYPFVAIALVELFFRTCKGFGLPELRIKVIGGVLIVFFVVLNLTSIINYITTQNNYWRGRLEVVDKYSGSTMICMTKADVENQDLFFWSYFSDVLDLRLVDDDIENYIEDSRLDREQLIIWKMDSISEMQLESQVKKLNSIGYSDMQALFEYPHGTIYLLE